MGSGSRIFDGRLPRGLIVTLYLWGNSSREMEERFQMAGLVIEVEVLDSMPIPCHGCEDYCGQTHGGDRLVCGIHPYGWEDSNDCPDWRGIVGTEEVIEFPMLDGSTPDLESDDETPSQVMAGGKTALSYEETRDMLRRSPLGRFLL